MDNRARQSRMPARRFAGGKWVPVLLLAVMLGGCLSSSVFAQVITGSILGAVTDPSGAAVPGAKISILNTGTNVKTDVTAGASGEFVAPYLPPGTYEVKIEASGFKTFRQSNLELKIDLKYRVDAVLAVGSLSESVEVVSNAQVLQTDQSDVSATVGSRDLQALPNVGRSPMAYVTLAPGVVSRESFTDPAAFGYGDQSRYALSNFSVNGSSPLSSEIMMDGSPNTGSTYNEIVVVPSVDALDEVKIITTNYSAEYGRASGGIVSFSTKSGTNAFHGMLSEFFQNPVLNANSYNNNSFGRNADGSPAQPKGKFNANIFGGTFSGPVLVPKVYNGRDKMFFFSLTRACAG